MCGCCNSARSALLLLPWHPTRACMGSPLFQHLLLGNLMIGLNNQHQALATVARDHSHNHSHTLVSPPRHAPLPHTKPHSLHACHVCGCPGHQEHDHWPQLLAPSTKYLVCCCHQHWGPVSHNVPQVVVHLRHVVCHWCCDLTDEVCGLQARQARNWGWGCCCRGLMVVVNATLRAWRGQHVLRVRLLPPLAPSKLPWC